MRNQPKKVLLKITTEGSQIFCEMGKQDIGNLYDRVKILMIHLIQIVEKVHVYALVVTLR